MNINLYQNLYDLLNTYVYSGMADTEPYIDLVCILCATLGTLFLIALPFLVVWRTIRILVR